MDDKICLIGSGNLGTNLAIALNKAGINIRQVISKTLSNAKVLAEKLNSEYTDNICSFDKSCTIILIAVSDDAIPEILNKQSFGNRLLLHTAGSVDMEIFSGYTNQYGIIYPLQTFKKNQAVNFAEIPIFIEGNKPEVSEKIESLAKTISKQVHHANSDERLRLHVAAVFACNFANHLFGIASELLQSSAHGFQAIKPLITETTRKALESDNPYKNQTGPALRNDHKTMNTHLELLNENQSLSELYKFMSNRIFETKKNRKND